MTEEEDETRRKTFVETGSDAFWSGEEVTMEGFLSMKLGGWRKRWCVIKEETFMFFHGKQEALKQGWLSKKGAGTGTLSRCVLQGLPLHHNTVCRDVCGGTCLQLIPSLPCVCVQTQLEAAFLCAVPEQASLLLRQGHCGRGQQTSRSH